MNDKKRLEEIKKIRDLPNKLTNPDVTEYCVKKPIKALEVLKTSHVEFLIEQAERVEELEDTYKVRKVEYLEEHIDRLEQQNQKYREAIERIEDSIPLEFKHGSEYEAKKNVIRLINIQKEVDKALEDSN